MKKILYVDRNGNEDQINHVLNILNKSGLDYDHLIKSNDREKNKDILNEFKTEYIPKINNYDLLIEHAGPFNYFDILEKNPALNILKLSSVPEDLELNEEDLESLKKRNIAPDRIAVASYSSQKIHEYINKIKTQK